jgi:Rho-related BTB domain-containing protein 1/2
MGQEVAKEIGAPFYESSVLTRFGVSDIFVNSARAALIERRKLKFWNTQLRRVQRPLLQAPMLIPKPTLPAVCLAPQSVSLGISALLYEQSECDVTLIAGGVCLEAHRVVLTVSCKVFEDLFCCEELARLALRRCSTVSTESDQTFRTQSITSDDHYLLDNDTRGHGATSNDNAMLTSATNANLAIHATQPAVYPVTVHFNHPAFECVEVKYHVDPYHPQEQPVLRVFITLHADITSAALQLILEFLYTGSICKVWRKKHFTDCLKLGLIPVRSCSTCFTIGIGIEIIKCDLI